MTEMAMLSEFGLTWLEGSGPQSEIALSTRVRLARNIRGRCFGTRRSGRERETSSEEVRSAAARSSLLGDGIAIKLSDLDPLKRRILLERHLISRELVGPADERSVSGTALLMSRDERVGAMVNEEDHLRLQAILSGRRLHAAFQSVDEPDDELGGPRSHTYHPQAGHP